MVNLTRDALVDAAKRAAWDAWRADNDMSPVSDEEWSKWRNTVGPSDTYARAILTKVLPLIADAIEAERASVEGADTNAVNQRAGLHVAFCLVRSLMGVDGE